MSRVACLEAYLCWRWEHWSRGCDRGDRTQHRHRCGNNVFVLAFIPKLVGAIAMMPGPVMRAGLLYTSCFLVISRMELIVSRMLDARRTFIVGLSGRS